MLANESPRKSILLFSGGIDSYVAWHFLKNPPTVYFDLNTPYSQRELKVVKNLISSTIIEKVIDFSSRQEGDHAYVPYRNLHLALLANKYADRIIIAGLKDDKVNDKNERVFRQFSYLMSDMMGRQIAVISPFWDMTKEQVVSWFLHVYGGNEEDLLNTISCYTPEKSSWGKDSNYCGECPACFRKFVALRTNGILIPFHNYNLMMDYKKKAEEGYYIPQRNVAILRVLKEYI